MVTLITGFPGSGKSYFAIDKIYNVLSNNHSLSKDIEVIYTNINGLKYDKFPSSNIELKKLHIEEFYTYLIECHSIYEKHKNDDNVDDLLIKYTKQEGYYNALIVFDECHDFLSNQDKVKIFWLTYHRHLHHEIDLLTQNKSLINTKYRAIPEIFIEAQPRSKKLLSSTLTYKHYASFAMRKVDLYTKSSIKTKQEVFALYQSGNTSKQKSILKKFLFIILIGVVIAALLFINLLSSFKTDSVATDPVKKENTKSTTTQPKTTRVIQTLHNDYYVMKIEFNSKDGYYIFDNYYSLHHFRKFIATTPSKVISKYTMIANKNFKLSYLFIYTSKEDLNKFFVLPKEKEEIEKVEVKAF